MALPNKNSSGYDQIYNKLLKLVGVEISKPLAIIFNESLSTGIFPDAMKMAEVIPLYKGKCRFEPGNYRLISLLLTISKILEKLIYKRTYAFLDSNNQIYHSQYGFRSKHSCENAIGDLVSQILKNQEQGKYTAALFLDLSKAFDTLNHELLLNKLEIYGVRGIALDWFKSYLNGRSMRLKYQVGDCKNKTYSEWYQTKHGTPQSSCLGPLLFLVFCNDLRLNLEYMSCIQFADDTTLFYADKNLDVLKCCVEHDIEIIMDWFRANSLTLNVQKTKYLLFRPNKSKKAVNLNIGTCCIKPDTETKFLGVILDDLLSWSPHVKNVQTKMKHNLGLLKRGRCLLSKHGLKNVYYAHIFSHVSYCISIWGSMISANLLSKLRTQQNQCIQLLDTMLSLTELYTKYKILTIDNVIDLELCKLGFKLHNEMLPVNLTASLKLDARGKSLEKKHNYNTRKKKELNLPMTDKNNYLNSFLFQAIKRHSALPSIVKNCTNYRTFVNSLKHEYFKV